MWLRLQIGKWLYIFFADGGTDALLEDFYKNAICTRLDIAFDWGGLPIGAIGSNVKNKQIKHIWTTSGSLGSVYYGPNAKHSQVVLYNKLAALKKDKKKDEADAIMYEYYQKRYDSVTRIEFREKPDAHLWQLAEHPFKFSRLQLFYRERFLEEFTHTPLNLYVWESLLQHRPSNFADHLSSMERDKALSALKSSQIMKPLIIKNSTMIWSPDAVYGQNFLRHVFYPLRCILDS